MSQPDASPSATVQAIATNGMSLQNGISVRNPGQDAAPSQQRTTATATTAATTTVTRPIRPIQVPLPAITNIPSRKQRKKQRIFAKDIENLLYSMGDRPTSTDLTVQALEEILMEYLTDFSNRLVGFARTQNRNRIKLNDLSVILKDDPIKLTRYHQILEQQYKIVKANKMFKDKGADEYGDDDEDGDGDGEDEDGDGGDVGDGEEGQRAENSEPTKRKYNKTKNVGGAGGGEEKRKYKKRTDKPPKKKKRKVTGNVMFKADDFEDDDDDDD